MRRFPDYMRRELPPAQGPSIENRPSPIPGAVQDLGGALQKAGGVMFDIGLLYQKRADTAAVSKAEVDSLRTFTELDSKYAQDGDYSTMLERFDDEVKQNAPQANKGITVEAQQTIEQNFEANKIRARDRIEQYRMTKVRDEGRASYLEETAAILNAVPAIGVEDSKKKIEALIERTKAANLITAEEGARHKLSADSDIVKIEAEANRNVLKHQAWSLAIDLENERPGAGLEMLNNINYFPDLERVDREELQGNMKFFVERERHLKEQAEKQLQEIERLEIVNQIAAGTATWELIKASHLDADEKDRRRVQAEARVKDISSGAGIVSDNKVRSDLYSDASSIIMGGQTKTDVLSKAVQARYVDKNLSEDDFRAIEKTVNQNYETALNKEITRVLDYGRGVLLNPDSMGYIRNAPIRYKIYGDFQQDFMDYVSKNGASAKPSDIFTEGRRLAAMHQVSEDKLGEMETDLNLQITQKEGKKYEPGRTPLGPTKEKEFQEWVKKINKKTGKNINPDDPNDYYDYRGAYKAGIKGPDENGQWPKAYLKEEKKIKTDVLGQMTRKPIAEPNFTSQQQDESLRRARKNLPADATRQQIIAEAARMLTEGK